MRTLLTLVAAGTMLCAGTNKTLAQGPPAAAGPGSLPVIVYKTKKNYRQLVPVTLSEDKSKVVSYPDPADYATGVKRWLPVPLHKGYLLDKRGINRNVAFLKLTCKQYAKLKQAPSVDELYSMIADKDPLTAFCISGNRSNYPADPVKKLNAQIDKKKLYCN